MHSSGRLSKLRLRWESFWRQRGRKARPSPPAAGLDSLALESLEDRILLAAPTAYEQYMLELVNAARRDPAAYAASLGISLNEGLPAGTLSSAMRQPLAFNPALIQAAANHSQWMLDQGQFSHYGPGGIAPNQRMTAAGYQFSGNSTWGENIAYRGTSGTLDPGSFTRVSQEALFVDAGVSGRGHRINLLNNNFMEVGIGIRTGRYNGFNALMTTQDFARTASNAFFTGVVYSDVVARDQFYTPGEGLGGITVTAVRDGGGQTYTTTTWASGGFSLPLPKGRYSFLVEGPGLSSSQFMPVVLMGTQNRKFDFVNGRIRQAPEIALSGAGYAIIHLDSTPRAEDGTHFGNSDVGSFVERTFTIRNLGNAPLLLNGAPRVAISGAHAADFSVSVEPPAEVAGGTSVTFNVRFNPTAAGLRSARLAIASNDSNESPFQFSLAGQGVNPLLPSAYYAGNYWTGVGGGSSSGLGFGSFAQSLPGSPIQSLPGPSTIAQSAVDGSQVGQLAPIAIDMATAFDSQLGSAASTPGPWSLQAAMELDQLDRGV